MAYVDQTARRPSLRIGLAVGLLHLGVGAALLTTFAGGAITAVIQHTLQGNNWTYVPPPPPKPAPTPERKPPPTAPTHIDTTQPVIDKLAPANPLPQTGPSTLPQIDDRPVVIRPTEPFFPPPPEPQIPPHLLRLTLAEISEDLALDSDDTVQILQDKRRAFARKNHPDGFSEFYRDKANIRMTVANLMVDEALRRLQPGR